MKSKWLAFLAVIALCLAVSACGGKETASSYPAGIPLERWPDNAVFADIPEFTAGTFAADKSEIKTTSSIVLFRDVKIEDFEAYGQALAEAGLDKATVSDSDALKNSRYVNTDGTVMVRLLYKVPLEELTITLVDASGSSEPAA